MGIKDTASLTANCGQRAVHRQMVMSRSEPEAVCMEGEDETRKIVENLQKLHGVYEKGARDKWEERRSKSPEAVSTKREEISKQGAF